MVSNIDKSTLTIWDSKTDPVFKDSIIYTWNGYRESEGIFSLFRYIDRNDQVLKKAYLEWIYEIGEYRISNKRIIDHLTFEDGFSYWWMTPFVGKDAWQQPVIMDVLRLLALADILRLSGYRHVRLVTGEKKLASAIESLCQSFGIPCMVVADESVETKDIHTRFKWYQKLPVVIKSGLSVVRFLVERWRLRNTALPECFGENAVFFCTYFFNLDKDALSKGAFKQSYWGDIMSILNEEHLQANWMQIFYPHKDIPNAATAKKTIRMFNADRNNHGYHFFAEGGLSVKSILFVVRQYFRLVRKYRIVKHIQLHISVNGITVNPWPLLKQEWKEAIIGPTAVYNLFFVELYSKLFANIPYQKKGIFLFENQSWDKALVYYWRKAGHGNLVAVPHSTVRYWDLRYFTDPRTLTDKSPNAMPFADVVAVNGDLAKKSFCSMGFPEYRVLECEALRYMGLNRMLLRKKQRIRAKDQRSILLLGDYQPEGTEKLLRLVGEVLKLLQNDISFTIKPHPNHVLDLSEFSIPRLDLITDSLENIILNFDMAVSGNTTSASVDAYIAGLPVIVLLDDMELNFNPLRGCNGVYFIDSAFSLIEAISNGFKHETEVKDTTFFHLDDEYPRWRRIIA
jgi:surface carbohydrate biosynthesis protein (TIGR04326 family)